MIHITEDRLRRYSDGLITTISENNSVREHLLECVTCRERIGFDLKSVPTVLKEASDILQHPPMAELIRTIYCSPDSISTPVAAHIKLCGQCQEEIRSANEYHRSIPVVSWDECETILNAKRQQSLTDSIRNWLASCSVNASLSHTRLHMPAGSLGFSTRTETTRQALTFDDDLTTGSYFEKDGEGCIHIEHTAITDGQLVMLQFQSASGAVDAWRFAVMRKGLRKSVTDARLDANIIRETHVIISPVDANEIPSELANDLLEAYKAACRVNAVAQTAWISWAKQVLETELDPEVQRVAEQIAIDN